MIQFFDNGDGTIRCKLDESQYSFNLALLEARDLAIRLEILLAKMEEKVVHRELYEKFRKSLEKSVNGYGGPVIG